MNQRLIIEGNKLFAQFMGWEQIESAFMAFNRELTMPQNLRFDSEWNWLMPVVSKIETVCQETPRLFEPLMYKLDVIVHESRIYVNDDIEGVWKSLHEFIILYNREETEPAKKTKYILFGEEAVEYYADFGFDELVEAIENNSIPIISWEVRIDEPELDMTELLDKYGTFTYITVQEFIQLSNA